MIKRVVLGLFGLLAVLVLVLLANTLRAGSRQTPVAALAALPVDTAAVAESLARAVQAKTVTGLLDPAGSAAAFDALHAHLRSRYPLVHQHLTREVVGAYSLLYTWRGSDPQARPFALLAHQDVAPVAPGTEGLWKQPPFSGSVDGGFVWGRGTLDDKVNLIAQLEAVELLLKAGFRPRNTVYLVFGHDEESGGQRGAALIAALLQQRGVKLDFVLDEGSAVTEGILPGVKRPLALIALGEKGILSVKLTATAPPGHSATPPAAGHSAIGMLAAALARLDQRPLPGGIRGAAAEMFEAIAPELPFGQRLAMANLWLLRPLVERQLAQGGGGTNAMLRTTTALTIVNAGNKENVLPGRAEAVVNFRILPGDSVAGVLAHVRQAVDDPRIEVQPLGTAAEPSKLSSSGSAPYRQIERTVREVFPDSIVAPGLMLQASDARHFDTVAEHSYRFMPMRFRPADLARLHGTDERVAVDMLPDMVRFYHRLLSVSAGPVAQPANPRGTSP